MTNGALSPRASGRRRHPSASRAAPATEAQLHRAVAQYLNVALPSDCWWTTFPSGGGGKVRGAQLKAMGLKAGVPDILIVRDSLGTFPAVIWIELKRVSGAASIAQKLCHAELNQRDMPVAICRSIPDVQETLIGWGIVKAWKGRGG